MINVIFVCSMCKQVCSHLRHSKALERLLKWILIPLEFLKGLEKLPEEKVHVPFPKGEHMHAKDTLTDGVYTTCWVLFSY